MKRLEEHSPKELLALNEDEVNALIALECAEEGAPVLPPIAPVAPVAPALVKETAYTIPSVVVRDLDTAQKICDLLNSVPCLETFDLLGSWRGPNGLRPRAEPISCSPSAYPTLESFRANEAAIRAHKTLKENYDEETRAFDSALSLGVRRSPTASSARSTKPRGQRRASSSAVASGRSI